MMYTLSDYFDWKVDTYKFEYYVAGFNVHPGELDDLSLDRFQGIEAKCEHFRDRADELLRFRYFEKAIKFEKKNSYGHSITSKQLGDLKKNAAFSKHLNLKAKRK